ncbi:MAG: spore germination protein [Muribaculum sp.]|nr:spore germination protein [Muribaculum sp.]
MKLTTSLNENIAAAHSLLPIGESFDIITRQLLLGETPAYLLGINGMCKTEVLQRIFSDLQNPGYMQDNVVEQLQQYMAARIGYAQVQLESDWDKLLRQLLSGPVVLLVDGFDQALVLDVRSYPARGISEPDTEPVLRGARDGFVETMLFNANLIRRRIRSPRLTFKLCSVGADSKTDVALAYVDGLADPELIAHVAENLSHLQISSLTMGAKSLEELLVKKRWYNPLPSMQLTERPDVACSYLMEGHVLLLVDNSPTVLILPSNIFQFTQSPDDYNSSPLVGSYFRLARFACIPVSLVLMPLYLLLTNYFPDVSARYHLAGSTDAGPITIFFYVLAVEFLLDLFKYSAAHSASRFSGSLSIVGGLIIGDIAVELNWASVEVLFYAAVTLLATLSLTSTEFADGLRLYRLFLILITGLGGLWGLLIGLALVGCSIATTPTYGGYSYLWPLFPFNWKALKTLLLRYPTFRAQPSRVWRR